jgi:hypothetical protein
MKQTNASRLADLILARLSVRSKKPPAPSDVSKSLYSMLARQFSASEWKAAFARALDGLRSAGLIEQEQLSLTPAGLERVQALLRLKAPPRANNWRELKARYLPRLFVPAELPEGAKIDLAAVVLAERLGLPITAKATLAQVARVAVAALSGAPRATGDAVTSALTLRWLIDDVAPAPRAPAATESTPRKPEATLQLVVAKVLAVARGSRVREYGPDKVFIASVWEALASDADIAALGEQGFKDVLAEAHRRGLLVLSRADLVAAMDPRDVAASETKHHNATYHFIQRGASA